MFEKKEIGITCPECGKKTKKSVAWIKANDNLTCSGCGSTVTVQNEKLLSGLKEAEQTVANFRKSLGKFGKRR